MVWCDPVETGWHTIGRNDVFVQGNIQAKASAIKLKQDCKIAFPPPFSNVYPYPCTIKTCIFQQKFTDWSEKPILELTSAPVM